MMKAKLGYIFLLSIICACIVILGIHLTSDTAIQNPVRYYFNSSTGKITFYIEDGYSLSSLQVQENRLSIPAYDKDTKAISFDVMELPLTQNQYEKIQVIVCSSDNADEYETSFEITRQSVSEIIVDCYLPDLTHETRSFFVSSLDQ